MTVVFYISGHGFGHASRDVEVINALGRRRPETRFIIRSAVAPDLLGRTLRVSYDLRPGETDTGIVQATSVSHDDDATVREAQRFYATFDDRIEQEVRGLAGESVDLVVGDIAPIAFEVASLLGVPSVAIANFTWDWIYETHPGFLPAAAPAFSRIRRAYAKATHALELPFAGGFEVFGSVTRVPLVARIPTRSRAETRAYFGVPDDRPLALLSFGGYGLSVLDLSSVDCLDRWTIATTDRSRAGAAVPPAVRLIEEHTFVGGGFRYEDLVAAADVVMTKPGYGIISECIAASTAMLYTERGHFREYDLLVRHLPRYLRSRFIGHADLFAGRWGVALDAVVLQPPAPERMPTNGAEVVAERLLELAGVSGR